MLQVDRFLQLAEWGLNVPRFVLNPCMQFGGSAYYYLKSLFNLDADLILLAQSKDKRKFLTHGGLRLQDVLLRAAFLELHNYAVLVRENVVCEFSGEVALDEEGGGVYYIGSLVKPFPHYDLIKDVKLRCIMRDLYEARKKASQDVCVYFGWATDFCGVNHSKLIVFDIFRFPPSH